jgi:hypothetical protein
MQSMHNRLGIAVLSLASLTAPSAYGQEREGTPKEGSSITSSHSSELKPLRGTSISTGDKAKLRAAEEGITQALLYGLEKVRSGSGSLVPIIVLKKLGELKKYTWRYDMKAGKAAAYIGDSSEVTVELTHLRAELITEDGKKRSYSVHQGTWKDGGLDTPADLMKRYLAPESLQQLIKELRKRGPLVEVSLVNLREAWPEWRIIADNKAARAEFVNLLEFALIKGHTLSDSEQNALMASAKKCVKFE